MPRVRTIAPEVLASLRPLAGWGFNAPRLSLREWWVYFMQSDAGGPIKIGATGYLGSRLNSINRWYPFGELAYAAISRGDFSLERALHQRFKHIRFKGEWFHPEQELLDFILAVPEPR